MPTSEELAAYYQDPAYFEEGSVDEGYGSYSRMEPALRRWAKRRLRHIEARIGRPGQILDFGCAGGFFLDEARARGWQIFGVELSRDMAGRAAGLLGIPVPTDLAGLGPEQGLFDVVTLWEVIEHLPDPLPELNRLRSLLRPGGMLALSTPNTGHWQALAAPAQWTSYRPPAHVLYLTESTLLLLMERAGFTSLVVERSSPLPALPSWLDRMTYRLQQGLADGSARHWRVSLYAWRAIRLAALGIQRLHPSDRDVYMTLEASAWRPHDV